MSTERNKPSRCIYCHFPRIWRHGKTAKNIPRFLCCRCRRTFTPYTRRSLHYTRYRRQRVEFVRLLREGRSVRYDAKRLGVSPTTVWRWRHSTLHRLARHMQRRPLVPAPVTLVSTRHLDGRRTHWGQQTNTAWALRHKRSLFHDPLAKTLCPDTAVNFSVAWTNSSSGTNATMISHSSPAGFSQNNLFRRLSHQTNVYKLLQSRFVCLRHDRSFSRRFPSVIKINWRQANKHKPFMTAHQAAVWLEHHFTLWMTRFKGVALRYIDHYITLFQLRRKPPQTTRWLSA